MATLDFSPYTGYPPEVGELIRVFRQGAKRGLLGLRVIILAALLAAATYLLALVFRYAWSQQDGSWLVLPAVLVGSVIFIVVAGGSKAMSYVREWRDIAVVGSEGLAYRHDDQWRVARWGDITKVTAIKIRAWSFTTGGVNDYGLGMIFDLLMMFIRGYRYYYSISTTSCGQIEVGGTLSGVDQLMDMVRERTFRGLEEQAMKDFEAGRDLDFGPITISKHRGLSCRKDCYAWSNIRSITAGVGDGRYLLIRPKKGRFMESLKVREHDVPNLELLMCIAARMMDCTWERGTRTLESQAVLPPVEITICPACGASNAGDETACALCGASLHLTTSGAAKETSH